MTLAEFRELVRLEFGERLERATPANVRDFLDRMQLRLHQDSGEPQTYLLEEEDGRFSYEEIVSDFFSARWTIRQSSRSSCSGCWPSSSITRC